MFCSTKLETRSFKKKISGCRLILGFKYFLFKSEPEIDTLLFPIITPSGFSIGTILNVNLFLSSLAIWISLRENFLFGSFAERNSISPLIMWDPVVSPGCTLAVKIAYFFYSSGIFGSVIVSKGTFNPDIVLLRVPFLKYLCS